MRFAKCSQLASIHVNKLRPSELHNSLLLFTGLAVENQATNTAKNLFIFAKVSVDKQIFGRALFNNALVKEA
ncbi:hypothetical protein T11_3346 [Trichinella zimbabwensis]|uniref:Uncharacterized protein n=1 Tax=Trichinella zimbabwensis TaxID=268475 RepID=A0A0V1HEZ3_9BILA|nr:hypothetical protein T11_3346 [Trichinella zimbabwensis]